MARDYINELPAKTAQNAIHLNDIVQKSNPYSMNPRDPLFTPDPNYDPQASREFNDFAAGNLGGAIKNVGGNWLEHSLQTQLRRLKSAVLPQDEIAFLESVRGANNPTITGSNANQTVNSWIDKNLTKYIKNDMGTPTDPVRDLADKGITHIKNLEQNPGNMLRGNYIAKERRAEGFPHNGYAATPAGKIWEMRTDSTIIPEPISKWAEATGPVKEKNPWIDVVAAKDPTAKVNAIEGSQFETLGFNHITDELKNAINQNSGLPAHLQLKPEALARVTVPQAVERVAKINAWRQMQIENAAKQNLSDFPVLHEAADGFKVHELKMPNTGQKDDYIKLQNALKNEGEQMGHCVGGYCDDVANGSSRIFSLRDSKGGSHATIEAYPSLDSSMAFYEANKEALESPLLKEKAQFINESAINPGEYLNDIKKLMDKHNIPYTNVPNTKFDINQIKGKSNGPVSEKYKQHIQGFLNKHADNIGDVSELENTGLKDLKFDAEKGMLHPSIIKMFESGQLPRFVTSDQLKNLGPF
jgi:hypothetical protein